MIALFEAFQVVWIMSFRTLLNDEREGRKQTQNTYAAALNLERQRAQVL